MELRYLSKIVRADILKMINQAQSGHPGGSLSAVEILVGLYFGGAMSIDENNPNWEKRDYFILSKGHVAPVLYAVLARRGYFDLAHLETLRKFKSILQGHPHKDKTPGLDVSSGSLGQGLSIANGLAIAAKNNKLNNNVYCLLGDGELQEGQVWEAAMTSAHYRLNNVCAIVDYNKIQLDGTIDQVMSLGDITKKWSSFGWHVIECDGHDLEALIEAYTSAKAEVTKPTVVIAHTVKGKGISFMENQASWHGNPPNEEQLRMALEEIWKEEGQI